MARTVFSQRNGVLLDLANPDPAVIHLPSVAIGLQRTSRFGGQTVRRLSVAQHCLLVGRLAATEYPHEPTEAKRARLVGLMHDAEEGLLGDVPTPAKTPEIRETWRRLRQACWDRLGMPFAAHDYHEAMERADQLALQWEGHAHMRGGHWAALDLYTIGTIPPWSWRLPAAGVLGNLRGAVLGQWGAVWLAEVTALAQELGGRP